MAKEFTDDQKHELRLRSRASAIALLDDLQHMRAVWTGQPTTGDVRRLTAQLRRLIVERDLQIVAEPRVGRLEITAPDLRHIHAYARKHDIRFFSAGHGRLKDIQYYHVGLGLKNLRIDAATAQARIPLRFDSYARQQCLCVDNEWVSRADIIKYIANVAHGVHSGTAKTASDLIVERSRTMHGLTYDGNSYTPHFDNRLLIPTGKPLPVTSNMFDTALLETLACAYQITTSPKVQTLESFIRAELDHLEV